MGAILPLSGNHLESSTAHGGNGSGLTWRIRVQDDPPAMSEVAYFKILEPNIGLPLERVVSSMPNFFLERSQSGIIRTKYTRYSWRCSKWCNYWAKSSPNGMKCFVEGNKRNERIYCYSFKLEKNRNSRSKDQLSR